MRHIRNYFTGLSAFSFIFFYLAGVPMLVLHFLGNIAGVAVFLILITLPICLVIGAILRDEL